MTVHFFGFKGQTSKEVHEEQGTELSGQSVLLGGVPLSLFCQLTLIVNLSQTKTSKHPWFSHKWPHHIFFHVKSSY